jgi:hypothetical protein
MPEVIILPFFFVSFFGALGYWIHLRTRQSRERLQAQMDLQTRVLERFESAQEFSSFLSTEGGQKFLSGLSAGERAGWAPARRILTGLQAGIVLCLVGLGLFAIAAIEGNNGPAYPGIISVALGLGFLISSALSFRLSKGWGLLPGGPGGDVRSELVNDLGR